jgi:hypothetical protein
VFEELEVPGIESGGAAAGMSADMPDGLGPGAFLGANAALIDEFRRLVTGELPR